MKIKYEARDGRLFDSEEVCTEYELTLCNICMLDGNGKRTTDLDCAVVIKLTTDLEWKEFENWLKLRAKDEDSIREDADITGIDFQSKLKGLYLWTESKYQYLPYYGQAYKLICSHIPELKR